MTDNPKRLHFNFNPWGKFLPDCSIRAISAATGLDYRVVCNMLKYKWKNGYGLMRERGASMEHIKQVFNEYFDIIEDFYENFNFVPDEFKGSKEDEEMKRFEI